MNKNVIIFIDPFTCDLHKISPEIYRDKLSESDDFHDMKIVINNMAENVGGDYTRTAAIARISHERNSKNSEMEDVFDSARQIFNELRNSR